MPQLTQLLRVGLRTGSLWSNLESGCCDDTEGVAETRWLMLSQVRMRAHTHTHTHTHTVYKAFTFAATEVRGKQRAIRRGQRRAEVYKEERPHFPGGQGIPFLVSLTQLYIPLPGHRS